MPLFRRIAKTEDEWVDPWYHLLFKYFSRNTPHGVLTHTERDIGRTRPILQGDGSVQTAAQECIRSRLVYRILSPTESSLNKRLYTTCFHQRFKY